MANISDTCGWITVKSGKKKVIKQILELMELLENGDYCTIINSQKKENFMKGKYVPCIEKGEYAFYSPFVGSGRWVYIENINKMFNWISDAILWSKCDKEYYRSLLEEIKKHKWSIEFDFTDYECGCQVFYTACYKLSHDKNQDLKDCSVVEIEPINDIEMNVRNYVEYADHTVEEALEELKYFYTDFLNSIKENDWDYLVEHYRGEENAKAVLEDVLEEMKSEGLI